MVLCWAHEGKSLTKTRLMALAGSTLTLLCTNAQAQGPAIGGSPAREMAAVCEGRVDAALKDFALLNCSMYILGVIDAHDLMTSYYGAKPAFCPPNRAQFSVSRIKEIFGGYIRIYPEYANVSTKEVLFRSLGSVYPCNIRSSP